MRVDVEKAGQESYDLCIVGTGPAGIILALEYQKPRPAHRILLIEYGRDVAASRNRLDDSIKIVEAKNHHPPYECTNKGLGGSSASWGGRCVMYDEVDFMQRKIGAGEGNRTLVSDLLNGRLFGRNFAAGGRRTGILSGHEQRLGNVNLAADGSAVYRSNSEMAPQSGRAPPVDGSGAGTYFPKQPRRAAARSSLVQTALVANAAP